MAVASSPGGDKDDDCNDCNDCDDSDDCNGDCNDCNDDLGDDDDLNEMSKVDYSLHLHSDCCCDLDCMLLSGGEKTEKRRFRRSTSCRMRATKEP